MRLQAAWCKHTLKFKFLAGTSRGSLKEKTSYFLKLWSKEEPEVFGLGEAGPLFGLSAEFDTLEDEIAKLVSIINKEEQIPDKLSSSLLFALETAELGLKNQSFEKIYLNDFQKGNAKIPINGLIWMGDATFMRKQIAEKLEKGFTTIKLKIGAIDFETEYEIIKELRAQFASKDLTIRVDANGAFNIKKAKEVLKLLREQEVHSIEQPIAAGQWEEMAALCENTPTPIALDEELIGQKAETKLLETIKPQYIILKPGLHGGLASTKEWIELAQNNGIAWWITSALESNVGLNAICQFTTQYKDLLPQGLGTGQLYHNNIPSPLYIEAGYISSSGQEFWDLDELKFKN